MLGVDGSSRGPYPRRRMPRASIEVEVPPDAWMAELSTSVPDATFRVLAAFLHEGSGVGVLEVRADDPLAVLGRIGDVEAVTALDLLWSEEGAALVQFETTSPPLLRVAHEAGVPIRTPFAVVDGRVGWDLTTSHERLGRLREHLEAAGIDFRLEFVRTFEDDRSADVLTDRQREVLLAARELGYYDVPRTATLTEVADSLGIAKATASDTLHRAESHLVDWFAGKRLGE